MTTTDKAVRKASRKRLLRDMARAARVLSILRNRRLFLDYTQESTSRTRYACLMTAFGQ